MSKLVQLIKALAPNFKSQKDTEDAYLSKSTDVYDLERRMHEIDLRGGSATLGSAFDFKAL